MSQQRYRFDRFELLTGERELLADGQPLRLGARAFDLLLKLIERRGDVVSHAQLVQLVWPEIVVTDNNVATQVAALRAMLGKHAIATIPGRGYRFAMRVEESTPIANLPVAPALAAEFVLQSPANAGREPTKADFEVRPYRFGVCEVRPDERVLLVDSAPVKLGARAFDLLLVLIQSRPRLLSKNDLLESVWPGLVVEENNLQTQVSALRRLLGPQTIETVPGRGYRFRAHVEGDLRGDTGLSAGASTTVAPGFARPTDNERPPALRTNLPEVLQPLLGREDDMAAMGTLIGQHRLITIVAAGGMGKTRLTQWLLAERRTAYAHGVCWVELAGLSDPALVVSTIACSMGLQLAGDDPLSGLVAALEGLSILVAIDNAEHLVDETARVVQTLLQNAPQLSLLVTSQMPLKCSGERVYRLGPLGLPDEPVGAEEALTFGAVALFVDCARAADRHFELTPQNVEIVVEICRNLDGMALAIELAAARVQLLGLARLSMLLSDRLRLLTGGNRTAPQRHQTLRAALEWSHALLSPVEQTVFRRLGVFVGGFDLDMAQQVVGVAENDALENLGIDPWTLVDALGGLVDRSLVAVDAGEPPRYRLLMSARSYALERLTAAEEVMKFRARHSRAVLDRFIAVNADCWAGRIGVDAAVDWLDQDIDNGREALNWALQHSPMHAVAAASAMELALTYDRRLELRAMWDATAPLAAAGIPDQIHADWLLGCARFWAVEQPDVGARWASEAITLARSTGDSVTLYQGLVASCFADFAMGRTWTQDRLQEFLDLEAPGWSARLKSRGAQAQHVVAHSQGRTTDAKDALDRCVQLGRQSGCSDTIFMGLCNLADVLLAGGDVDAAVRMGREAVREATINRRNRRGICAASVNLTGALLAQGALGEARRTAEEAWPMAKAFLRLSWMADYVSLLAALEGRFRDAARLCGAANSLYAARGCAREVNEAAAARRAAALARDHLDDSEVLRLQNEGAVLCDSELTQAAFGWNKG